jgi:hypothetical protein
MLTRRLVGPRCLRTLREPWLSCIPGERKHARYPVASYLRHICWGRIVASHTQVLDGAHGSHHPNRVSAMRRFVFVACGAGTGPPHEQLRLAVSRSRPASVSAKSRRAGRYTAAWPDAGCAGWPRIQARATRCAWHARSRPSCPIVNATPCNTLDTQRPFPALLAWPVQELQPTQVTEAKRESGAHTLRSTACRSAQRAAAAGSSATPADGIDAAYRHFCAIEGSGWKGEEAQQFAPIRDARLLAGTAGTAQHRFRTKSRCWRAVIPIAAQFSVCVNGAKHVLRDRLRRSRVALFSPAVLMAAWSKALRHAQVHVPGHDTVAQDCVRSPRKHSVSKFRERWRAAVYHAVT